MFTDHKGLEWLTTQKKLSLRQAHWLEVLSEFDFEIIHIPGVENVLADALSRIYGSEPSGTVRAASEYVGVEEEDVPCTPLLNFVLAPIYTGMPLFLGATAKARCSARIAANRVAGPSWDMPPGTVTMQGAPGMPATGDLPHGDPPVGNATEPTNSSACHDPPADGKGRR